MSGFERVLAEVARIEMAFGLRVRFNCSYVRPCGVTYSNPYLTVGPGQHEADRDSGTNGNIAIL